jgi:hypothetical protein
MLKKRFIETFPGITAENCDPLDHKSLGLYAQECLILLAIIRYNINFWYLFSTTYRFS